MPKLEAPAVEPRQAESEAVKSFDDLTRALARLAEAESGARWYRRALSLIANFFHAPYAALDLRANNHPVAVEEGGTGARGEFWQKNCQEFLSESLAETPSARYRLFEAKTKDLQAALLSAPIFDERGSRIGCMVTATQVENREHARLRLAQLERAAIFLTLFQASTARESRPGSPAAAGPEAQQASAGVLARVSGYRSRTELAFALTNGLRSRTDCDLVALGILKKGRIKVISISGTDEVKSRCPGTAAMITAMEEGADAERALVWPQNSEWLDQDLPRNFKLHQRWSEIAGHVSVATLPLLTEAGCTAVLALRKSSGSGFSPEQVANISQTCTGYAAALDLVHRAGRGLMNHAFDSSRTSMFRLLSPREFRAKILPVLVLLLLAWLSFGSLPYRVSGKATLAQSELAKVASPHDGRLVAVSVEAGDQVTAGQVLCVFDTRDLELESARLQTEVEMAAVDLDRALAEGNAAEAGIARARRASQMAALNIARHRIESATVRSPIAGTVLVGDLRDRVGDLLPLGQPLFEVAPDRGWRLRIKLDESELALFDELPRGEFSARARPDLHHQLQVIRVLPKAEQFEQKNVFIAEAEVDEIDAWMRNGMEGVASLNAGSRPVWWIASRRVTNWLKLNFWL